MMSLPRIPIWQAPTGSIAGPELCAAVAEAGGCGAMGVTWTEPAIAADWVKEVKSKTAGLFQVNFALAIEPKGLQAVLDAGVPMVSFSWGEPGEYVDLVRSAGALLAIQVVSEEGAKSALRHRPDVLICQGFEAGGHVQSDTPLTILLPKVVQAAKGIPVVAAGGIATREHVRQVLRLGATGVLMGTRFVASQESRAHATYKRLLVERAETEMTLCFDIGWPTAKQRVLPNETLTTWKSAGRPSAPDRPGEGDIVAWSGKEPIYRYEDTAAQVGMEGSIEEMCLYAGSGVADIDDLPSAAELVARLAP